MLLYVFASHFPPFLFRSVFLVNVKLGVSGVFVAGGSILATGSVLVPVAPFVLITTIPAPVFFGISFSISPSLIVKPAERLSCQC